MSFCPENSRWTAEQCQAINAATEIFASRNPNLPHRVVTDRIVNAAQSIISLHYWDLRPYSADEIADLACIENTYTQAHMLWQGARRERGEA